MIIFVSNIQTDTAAVLLQAGLYSVNSWSQVIQFNSIHRSFI